MKDIAYFRLLTIQSADKYTIYSGSEDRDSMFLSISSNNSTFMNRICSILYKNPMSVSLISDCAYASKPIYSIMSECNPHCLVKSYGLFNHIYELVWGKDAHAIEPQWSNRGRLICATYLINHNKKVYFDLDQYEYYDNSVLKIHPLAALTVVGFTSGIDYYGTNSRFKKIIPAGSWAFDIISVDIEPPKGYKKIRDNFTISNEFFMPKDQI